MSDTQRTRPPFDRRLALLLVATTAAPMLALVTWAMANADRLPDPVAHHWGPGGRADGFAALWVTLAMAVGITLVVAVPMAVAALTLRETMMRRTMAGVAAGVTVFVIVLVADSLRTQIGLADAAQAPSPSLGMGLGSLLGIAVGAVAAKAVRPLPREMRLAARPPAASLPRVAAGAPIAWEQHLPGSKALAVILLTTVALTGGLAFVAGWGLLVVAAAVAVLLVVQLRLRVSISAENGLEVRGIGFRLLRVPPDEIAMAEAGTVDPWQFGGWGLRLDVNGRTGVITRKGPALHVTRGDGSEVVVSLDDPDVAAAALNSAADMAHAAG
ncbi:MAG TPA: DUF1648 domain-containing protein [Egicoccus sp.]|nr:DUF1648 domain-containing protein [Egicoccus sp.]HSK23195.1 DUF1648 domain-containing protein [Egicoccus sp.]